MKKRIFGNRSRTKHVLAILLAVSMTVQQGGFVPASEGEVSIASEQPADAEAQARAQAEACRTSDFDDETQKRAVPAAALFFCIKPQKLHILNLYHGQGRDTICSDLCSAA